MRSFGMIIGITGPSGSGKSLFCSMLAERGFTVLDCDKIYHDMISAPGECTAALAREFGNEILNAQGGIDRSALADRVFNSAEYFITDEVYSLGYSARSLRSQSRS